MAPVNPGDPQQSPRPQPIGNMPLIILFTTCTMCALFILWRRADSFRQVVSHQLKTITRPEGRIRLSVDDGPPAREFLEDDYDDDHEPLPSPPPHGPVKGRGLINVDAYDAEVPIAGTSKLAANDRSQHLQQFHRSELLTPTPKLCILQSGILRHSRWSRSGNSFLKASAHEFEASQKLRRWKAQPSHSDIGTQDDRYIASARKNFRTPTSHITPRFYSYAVHHRGPCQEFHITAVVKDRRGLSRPGRGRAGKSV
ncbi:hypothetical protein LshimejAT787_1701350 [Lyophyllum shimeji]|uniref:Uncharacterized protein n=1 Tax=Lyophyllum shimeji TaxID=47721 RepID=A0A9P3PZQ4_LYOSH|nr:hypothetical protein LshimejAT787_1701350 [Lyophyllum shimeji]